MRTYPTILQRSWIWDGFVFLGYNAVSHFAFAPAPLELGNLLVSTFFLLGQVVAVYGILWFALPQTGWRVGAVGAAWFGAGVALSYGCCLLLMGGAYPGLLIAIPWSILMLTALALALHACFGRKAEGRRV